MNNSVVISTRVRLARNIKDFPFPCKLSQVGREKVVEKVKNAITESNSFVANDFSFIKMSELSPAQCVSLVEKRLVSSDFVSEVDGRALLLSSDEAMSIMINEEDHIRIQAVLKGFSLEDTFDFADKFDTLLDENLDFAFDDKLGYLTQCPTNLGTGMRASVMLHLPALEKTQAIARISGNLAKLGLTIRGAYGEGTEPKGALYQLSNQVTLGISEKAAIENLKNITTQLVNQEKITREKLCKNIEIQDIICRSYGILKYAKTISHDEALRLLSNVRFGVEAEILENISLDVIDKLMIDVEPATLTLQNNKSMSVSERDIARAELIKNTL